VAGKRAMLQGSAPLPRSGMNSSGTPVAFESARRKPVSVVRPAGAKATTASTESPGCSMRGSPAGPMSSVNAALVGWAVSVVSVTVVRSTGRRPQLSSLTVRVARVPWATAPKSSTVGVAHSAGATPSPHTGMRMDERSARSVVMMNAPESAPPSTGLYEALSVTVAPGATVTSLASMIVNSDVVPGSRTADRMRNGAVPVERTVIVRVTGWPAPVAPNDSESEAAPHSSPSCVMPTSPSTPTPRRLIVLGPLPSSLSTVSVPLSSPRFTGA
jgi:hypothetical protein